MSVDLRQLEAAGFSAKGGDDGGDDKRAAAEEQRRVMLSSLLDGKARERLNRVAIVKPENARAVEDHIIRLARGGKLSEKVSEDMLIRLLEEVGKMEAAARAPAKVTITRRKRVDEEDDADDDL